MDKDTSNPKSKKQEKTILVILLVLVIISIILYFVIPRQKTEQSSESEKTEAENKISTISEISVNELREKLENKDEFILLDVREPIEYAEEHIDGATSIPLGELEAMSQFLPTDVEIITICDGSNCQRGLAAAQQLIDQGYTQIKNVSGGTKEWKEQAFPVTVGVVSEVRLLSIPEITPNELKSYLETNIGITLIDVRNSLDFTSGHIPQARNISFADVESMAINNTLNLNNKIVVYGGTSDVKTDMAAQTLLANGAKNISILAGGFPQWENSGYNIEK